MKRPTISMAMIVKNEAENLPRIFKSIEGCFDEIHITDTGSTDDTVKIAQELGAKVHHFGWCDDFALARNASFEPITTDFVFWMDGDDVLEDREAFINFRDNVMDLADYWVANYIYSSDASGKAMCTFARERVFRTSKKMRWRYFVHEGVQPQSPVGPVKSQFVPSWRIRHMRTDADLQKDKLRNLSLFEKHKNSLDARMQYYYGKELFEAQKPMEAAAVLMKVLSSHELELHDRILAIQYATFCYGVCNQYERVIDVAHTGLQIAPLRAEFHTAIGDSYLKMNRLQEALPFFQAAKSCPVQNNINSTAPIFQSEDAYTVYPRNQTARIYANLGMLDEAYAEADDCVKKYASPEAKIIQEEVLRMRSLMRGTQTAKSCEDIVITCPPQAPYLWDADIAKEKSMGGSETACIEMAYWLHKLSGRPVKVFNVREQDKVCDGVEYIDCRKLSQYMADFKPWVHIAWRHTNKITDAPTFIWCHDLMTPGVEFPLNYIKAFCLTDFHADFMKTMQNVPAEKIHITRNGLKPKLFEGEKRAKDLTKVVYPSSPDRGLDRAMLVMDKVRERYPDLKLHVFYGIEHLPKWGHQALHDKLVKMFAERPWVIYHGATQQQKLVDHFKEAIIWLHPADFIETSCITAMEMIAAGVYPVTRRLGGLKDTLALAEKEGMATLLDSDCITDAEYQFYIEAMCSALEDKKWERVSVDPNKLSWETVAREWLDDLPKLMVT